MSITNVTTPDLGGAADVTVIEILVKPGDAVQADMPVVTLESDKATMDIPSAEAGVVKEIKVKVGDTLSAGSLILTLETGKAEAKKETKKAAKKDAKKEATEEMAQEEDVVVIEKEELGKIPSSQILNGELNDAPTSSSSNDVHAGPGVRRMARELGVNLALVTGSGPKTRILKEDVQSFVKNQLTQVQTGVGMPFGSLPSVDFTKFGSTDLRPLTRIQKISGKNLQRNWMMIPHVTQFGEADISSLDEFRQSQKVKLTPVVFVMKAVIASLKEFPNFNASIDANGENLVLKKYFNIGVAVDTPDGLVVPVIRDVDKKGLVDLAKELAEISEKARSKQLTPNDMQGGCFSVSSLGGVGGTAFTPIINYPEVAILGVSKTSYKPVYEDGIFVPKLMLPLSLSYDHRVIDGVAGARFMVHLTNMLSDIRNLLL